MGKPVGQQLLSGIRLTGVIGLILLALFVLFDGELRTAGAIRAGSLVTCIAGLIELVAVGVLLWLTAGTWSRAIAAVCFLAGLKAAVGLVTGATVFPLFQPASRIVAAESVTFLLLAGLLSMRFTNHRPRTLEKIGLITFVFSMFASMLWDRLPIVVVGLTALVAARFAPASFVNRRDKEPVS
jgi:hypothetical protein